jgi:hypothetical protein
VPNMRHGYAIVVKGEKREFKPGMNLSSLVWSATIMFSCLTSVIYNWNV